MSTETAGKGTIGVVKPSLTIAVAQPGCVAGDVARNAMRHAAAVRAAASRVVVFPELSLTGYELQAAPAVDPGSSELSALVAACAETDTIALAGAPVHGPDEHTYIATLAVTGCGVQIVYRKMWLGSEERERFHPGLQPAVCDVDGWTLGLAICKDTSITAHTCALSELAIDVYVAGLVMHPHEIDDQNERARRIATDLNVYVAFAGFAGPTGNGYTSTAGGSSIWSPEGVVLAQADTHTDQIARATLPTAALDALSPHQLAIRPGN